MTPIKKISGDEALTDELNQLSQDLRTAAAAPRGNGLAAYLAAGLAAEPLTDCPGPFERLTRRLLQRLTVWWPPSAYASLPTMVPWCIRDRTARYDHGPESWGMPNDDGHFRDDNSIIKKLPLPLPIDAPPGHPYAHGKVQRGFTACHIWRELPDGRIAGTDPWLYSFMPNLVWMPSALSYLSDQHESHVQRILQATSIGMFRSVEVRTPLGAYAETAWAALPAPPPGTSPLDIDELALFHVDGKFIQRRAAYLTQVVSGVEEALLTGAIQKKVISTRYTQGLPGLENSALENFRNTLTDYRAAIEQAR